MSQASSETVPVHVFFEEVLPSGFAADAPQNPNPEDVTLAYRVEGEGGGDWLVKISGGKMSVERVNAPALLTFTLSALDLLDAINGRNGAAPSLVLPRPSRPGQSSAGVRALRGTMALELARGSVDPFRVAMCFNGAAMPRTTMRMALADYLAMQEGRLNGQEAFMTGKMKVEGDMAFLMQVAMATAS